MRKILLLLFVSVCAACTYAQNYDETELLGKWDVASITGQVNNEVISFESLYLGDTIVTQGVDDWWPAAGYFTKFKVYDFDEETHNPQGTYTYDKEPISDFFISNNNKLHIVTFPDLCNQIRLVIKEWTNDVMKLESYDGETKIELKKDKSAVKLVMAEIQSDGVLYDVQGHKVKQTEKGNIYIQNNRKFIAQ